MPADAVDAAEAADATNDVITAFGMSVLVVVDVGFDNEWSVLAADAEATERTPRCFFRWLLLPLRHRLPE
jgi:hypothetical protein